MNELKRLIPLLLAKPILGPGLAFNPGGGPRRELKLPAALTNGDPAPCCEPVGHKTKQNERLMFDLKHKRLHFILIQLKK
jgi:hypothetical protein